MPDALFVFFREVGVLEWLPICLRLRPDGRINLARLVHSWCLDPGPLCIGDTQIAVDDCGISVLTWPQLKHGFNLVGTFDEPVLLAGPRVAWKVTHRKESFSHRTVIDHASLNSHVEAFQDAFSVRKRSGGVFDLSGVQFLSEMRFLARIASFWDNDVARALYEGRVVAAFRETGDILEQAVEEVMNRARKLWKMLGSEEDYVVFGAAVARDSRKIIPLVVFPSRQEALKGQELALINDDCQAFKELAFQIFVAARLVLSGRWCYDEYTPELSLVLRDQDGSYSSFKAVRYFTHSDYRGGTYLVQKEGVSSSDGVKFVMKVVQQS